MKSPKLRFREFKHDWKFNKFSDITEILRCGIASTPIYVDEGVPFLSAQNVTSDGQISLHKYSLISEAFYKKISRNNELKKGDLLYSRVGAGYGKAALFNLEGDYGVYVSLTHIRPTTTVNPEYLKQYLNSPYGNAQAKNGVVQGGGVPNLNVKSVEKFLIPLPSLEEQEKIGVFLKFLDQKIALLNDEYKYLIAYKKGVMQELFNRKIKFQAEQEEPYPEWECKTIGEVFQDLKGSALPKEALADSGTYKCILYGELFTKYSEVIENVFSSTNSSAGTPSVSGDLLMPSSTTTSAIDLAIASTVMEDGVLLGGDIIILRPKLPCDSRYMAYFITHGIKKELAKNAQGITIIHMYFSKIKDVTLKIPCLIEQTKIANFLSAIDDKITNMQAQVEATKQYKQGLLQQMFI